MVPVRVMGVLSSYVLELSAVSFTAPALLVIWTPFVVASFPILTAAERSVERSLQRIACASVVSWLFVS